MFMEPDVASGELRLREVPGDSDQGRRSVHGVVIGMAGRHPFESLPWGQGGRLLVAVILPAIQLGRSHGRTHARNRGAGRGYEVVLPDIRILVEFDRDDAPAADGARL